MTTHKIETLEDGTTVDLGELPVGEKHLVEYQGQKFIVVVNERDEVELIRIGLKVEKPFHLELSGVDPDVVDALSNTDTIKSVTIFPDQQVPSVKIGIPGKLDALAIVPD